MSSDPRPVPRPCIGSFAPYHPGKPIADVQRELGLPDVIKLASNENALGASPRARQAILDSLRGPDVPAGEPLPDPVVCHGPFHFT